MISRSSECLHELVPESRSKIKHRFITEPRELTLEEVLDLPLNLPLTPSSYNTTGPTPLDPERLSISGLPYEVVATAALAQQLEKNQTLPYKNSDAMQSNVERIRMEIQHQHEHRTKKNTESVGRLREYAATDPGHHILSHEYAEGVMQLRAGVARITPALTMLANFPALGAIELTKATRPLCVRQYNQARIALNSTIRSLLSNKSVITETQTTEATSPYRMVLDERHGAVILKSVFAKAKIGNQTLEIIGRDSFIGINSGECDGFEHMSCNFGDGSQRLDVLPIDVTSYARVAS